MAGPPLIKGREEGMDEEEVCRIENCIRKEEKEYRKLIKGEERK